MMAQLLPHPTPDFFCRYRSIPLPLSSFFSSTCSSATVRNHERGYDFAVAFVRQADDGDFRDGRMREEAVFDLERVDVLAALDDEVLDAAGDGDVAGGVDGGFVARLFLKKKIDKFRKWERKKRMEEGLCGSLRFMRGNERKDSHASTTSLLRLEPTPPPSSPRPPSTSS